jgi:hypothetical protein
VWQSGLPFTVNSAIDNNRDGNLTDRPAGPEGILWTRTDRVTKLVRTEDTASLLALGGQDGSLGRNTYTGDSINNCDLAVSRTFRVRSTDVQLRVEAFNAFNRPHFAIPVRVMEFPSFGRATEMAGAPRVAQVSVKVGF